MRSVSPDAEDGDGSTSSSYPFARKKSVPARNVKIGVMLPEYMSEVLSSEDIAVKSVSRGVMETYPPSEGMPVHFLGDVHATHHIAEISGRISPTTSWEYSSMTRIMRFHSLCMTIVLYHVPSEEPSESTPEDERENAPPYEVGSERRVVTARETDVLGSVR